MRKSVVKKIFTIFSAIIITCTSSPAITLAVAPEFLNNNDIIYYDPNMCSTEQSGAGVPGEGGHVYNGSAPDPSVILGEDGVYHLYATGGVHLTSSDMTSWEKQNNGWNLNGAPNDAGGAKWAPDVAKIGSKYVFTYTIPTGTPENPGGGPPKIGYATGDSAGGPFTYRGKLNLSYQYSIDSHIFVDDDGTPWLFWGGGEIHGVKLKLEGDRLTTVGTQKELLTKGGVGSDATIEGSWVVKRNGWYYLTYSQGHYRRSDGAPEYRVLVARSKDVMGPYKPDDSMKPLLEASGDTHFPGHHSIVTDGKGQDWIVYHGYYKNEMETRSLFISKLGYDGNWPVLGGSSSSATAPTSGTGAPDGQVKVSQANIKVSSPTSEFNQQLNRIIERNPDFISGNEWSSRSDNDIKRPGYDFYRGQNGGDPSRAAEGDVVMWKSDKWTKVDSGTVKITLPADKTYHSTVDAAENWDGKRSMAWVTLQDASGNKVSMASIHHIVNPAKYAPRPERKALYKLGMERAIEQLKKLQGVGPVILAGDFNAQTYRQPDNTEPWHPKQMLSSIDMEATAYSLPKPGPVNVAVDYIFYTKKDIKAVSHTSPFMLTDHPYLEAVLEFQGNATYNGTSSNNCVCSEEGSGSATILEGNDNVEKVWNYLVGQMGYSPKQAAGVMGNIQRESGFDPQIIQGGGTTKNPRGITAGWGLIQWTPADPKVFNSARDAGATGPIYELGTQLDILKAHMDGRVPITTGQFSVEEFKQIDDIRAAVEYFEKHIEGAGVKAIEERVGFANAIYEKYSGETVPTSGASSSTPSGGCTDGSEGSGEGSDFSADGMVIYNQEDPRWANEPFGTTGRTIKTSGCGPTSMATIITALTNKAVTPSETTAYANTKNLYVPGSGASWSLGPVIAEHWGLKSKSLSADVSEINDWLRRGGLIITSGTGAAPFTSSGHYITIRGVTENGKWKIADSNGTRGQENSKKEWDPNVILGIANGGNIKVIYK